MSQLRNEILAEIKFWQDEDHDHERATTQKLGILCHDNEKVCPVLREFSDSIRNILAMKQRAGITLVNNLQKLGL